MRALMFGGAFNPPTRAHIELADFARKQMNYDVVIFVPTKMNYITDLQKKNYAFTDEERLEMLHQIASKHSWMKVSSYEIDSESQPRTYQTLCALKEAYKFEELKLLFGSDKLIELETGWKHVEELCQQFGIVCMTRTNDDTKAIVNSSSYLSSLSAYITLLESPDTYQCVSSSHVRKKLTQIRSLKEELEKLVPEELNGLTKYF